MDQAQQDEALYEIKQGFYFYGKGQDFQPDDIETVIKFDSYSPEGYGSIELWSLVSLKDGRFGAIVGGCDTTGWDCRGQLDAHAASTLESAIDLLDSEGRTQLGVSE